MQCKISPPPISLNLLTVAAHFESFGDMHVQIIGFIKRILVTGRSINFNSESMTMGLGCKVVFRNGSGFLTFSCGLLNAEIECIVIRKVNLSE